VEQELLQAYKSYIAEPYTLILMSKTIVIKIAWFKPIMDFLGVVT